MKKIWMVLMTVVLCAAFAVGVVCAEESPEGSAGMPNPIVEYASLEEINEKTGVSLMKPPTAEVSEESFSVISDTIAQYVCKIDGREWIFRGAYITDEDISGMYDEHNEFSPYMDFTLYTNEFYLERFFDDERQYTIAVMNPVSPEGEVLLDEERFSEVCMSLEAYQKQHIDDPLVGDWQDTVSQRATAYVQRIGDIYFVSVNWADSAYAFTCWTMVNAVREGDRLTYQGEEIGHYTYDEDGNDESAEVTMANNVGYFEIRDGLLYWTGAAQETCRACVFEKCNP